MCVCTFSSLLIRFISRQQKSHILSSAHNFMQPLATLARHNFRKHGWKEKCKWHEAHWIVRAHIHCKRRTSKETRTAIARPVTASNSKDDNLWTFSGRNHIIQNYLLASVALDPPDRNDTHCQQTPLTSSSTMKTATATVVGRQHGQPTSVRLSKINMKHEERKKCITLATNEKPAKRTKQKSGIFVKSERKFADPKLWTHMHHDWFLCGARNKFPFRPLQFSLFIYLFI